MSDLKYRKINDSNLEITVYLLSNDRLLNLR